MRSRLRIGAGFQYLARKAEDGNEQAKAEIASLVQPQSVFLFDAFVVLSKSRTEDHPISIRDIIAYSDFLNITAAPQKQRFVRAMQEMDRTFREFERGRT